MSQSKLHAYSLVPTERPRLSEDNCSYKASCSQSEILFQIHAETADFSPYACLNDKKLFGEQNFTNGMSFVFINGSNGNIESYAFFDVSKSDRELVNWLKSLPYSSVIIGLSFGDVAEMISADARATFASFGAVRIVDWRRMSSYAILGQNRVGQSAFELVVPLFLQNVPHIIERCFEFTSVDASLNLTHTLTSLQRAEMEEVMTRSNLEGSIGNIQLGAEWLGCGIPDHCNSDEIPMYFFSGEHKDDWPRLCVGGYMIFDRGLNNAGRESTALEQWLDDRPLGEVIAVLSFDEASNMLTDMAKQIFYEMGSSMVQRLRYFVGHRELAAYSPFEDLNIPSGNTWAKPIRKSICLPKKLESWRGRASVSYLRPYNLPRRHFCMKHDQHGNFCSGNEFVGLAESEVDKPIHPRALSDPKRKEDPVFKMPIVVAAGLSTDSLRMCLESLMEQEGLNTQMVVVVYDKEYPENAELSSLFKIKSLPVHATNGYSSVLLSALSAAFDLFPSSPTMAVIEEDVKLSPDWLYYLSQASPVLLVDKNIGIVQTFNPNGISLQI
ncbi:hypothetical protein DICVIV_12528 [Dictyocaulus viviparus]|uniref:ILEI/PANDER domain-containing protein n=1 Tax=Dictyocaulus viviparus TaxID=29172 RepID=A0A0D8XCW0_DICVI|nr:hypothetical protein DICVIV_12528 [Dictyocaulus viviparus]